MAAIALALGMAIDANVLINERIREELRAGANPQHAILQGFDRAWATILDSNVTTLIVGLALVGIWLWSNQSIRDRSLLGYFDVDLLRCVCISWRSELVVWPSEEIGVCVDWSNLEANRRRCCQINELNHVDPRI